MIGRRVAVYGGGNTAMDAARTARRLGAEETLIVYRRTREQMPAHWEEAADAEREGVRINWLRTIAAFEGPDLQVEAMELDESGYPQPTGRFETLAADTVILALGQDAETEFLRHVPGVEFQKDGTVVVSPSLQTGCPGPVRGRRHGAERAYRDGRRRPRQEGSPPYRRLAAQRAGGRRHPSTRKRASTSSTSGTSGTTRAASSPRPHSRSGSPDSSEVVGSLTPGAGRLRSRALPFVRQLLRVRRVPRRLSRGRCDQARAWQPVPLRLRPLHGLRDVLRAMPGPRDRDGRGAKPDAHDNRRQRGGRLRRLPAERGLLHLPDHALVADGRARRRVVEPGQAKLLGRRPLGGRDAERGRSGRRLARSPPRRRARDHLHGVSGPASDDPEHVQDRR